MRMLALLFRALKWYPHVGVIVIDWDVIFHQLGCIGMPGNCVFLVA